MEQDDFNHFVREYNEDYLLLLRRASTGIYACLITSARILKDLHEMIVTLQRTTQLEFQIVPLPFTFRASEEYYWQLGFDQYEIINIHAFLDHVRCEYGREFEECMEEKQTVLCG